MIKSTRLYLFILFSFSAFGGQIHIEHPCSSKSILLKNISEVALNETVFSLTEKEILANKIDADLASNGIRSILGYVSSEQSLEIVGPNKMRAYGWCYSINDLIPDEMPDQIPVKLNDSIKWFLSYSTYENNQWIDYCVPVQSSTEATQFICQ